MFLMRTYANHQWPKQYISMLLFTNFEVRTARYSEYFLYETNNWSIKALSYNHYEFVKKPSQNLRKTAWKLVRKSLQTLVLLEF